MGVTTHFSEITKFQVGKKIPCIIMYFKAFLEILLANGNSFIVTDLGHITNEGDFGHY